MNLSPLALEDVEALCLGPSLLMADPMGPLLDQDEEALSPSSSLEGKAPASPPLSFSSYASSLSPFQTLPSSPPFSASPPPSPPDSSFLGTKVRVDPLSPHWLDANGLLDAEVGADNVEDDEIVDMDWMSEKFDLSEFDLDSLISSPSSEESPSSPNGLLTSFDSPMEMDLASLDKNIPTLRDSLELGLSLPGVRSLPLQHPAPGAAEAEKTEETPHQEVILKSEPSSPAPSPSPSPPSPAFTLELASEVDLSETKKVAASLAATIIADPSSIQTTSPIVLSVPSSGHIVVVLTNKNEPPLVSLPDQSIKSPPPSSDSESDSGIESIDSSPIRLHSPPPNSSPSAGSSRTKPYSKPEPNAASPPAAKSPKVKSTSGAPRVVEKKLKKMEQNKTAATRYRQKKRFEQELLSTELQGLEKKNRELTEKAESINREIQYLKDLMDEVRKHRRGKTSPVVQ